MDRVWQFKEDLLSEIRSPCNVQCISTNVQNNRVVINIAVWGVFFLIQTGNELPKKICYLKYEWDWFDLCTEQNLPPLIFNMILTLNSREHGPCNLITFCPSRQTPRTIHNLLLPFANTNQVYTGCCSGSFILFGGMMTAAPSN